MQVTYCADAVVFAWLLGDIEPFVLLGVRGKDSDAFPGFHCIPGGGVEPGELAREAASRELREETGLIIRPEAFTLTDVADDPDRDPRGPVVSAVYAVGMHVPVLPTVTGADDLEAADWCPVDAVFDGTLHMAFDHAELIERALHMIETRHGLAGAPR